MRRFFHLISWLITINILLVTTSKAVPGGILTSDSQFNAYAARFKRWTHPINPQTVYDEYMKGNGQGSMIGAYGVDVSILKDNIEERKFSLL